MEAAIGFGGVVIGFCLSFFGTWWRDRKQVEERRRSLAAALSAELRALAARGRALFGDSVTQDGHATIPPGYVIEWSAEESYFCVYDSVAGQLGLLPRDLLAEVVTVYVHGKAAVDTVRVACRVTSLHPPSSPPSLERAVRFLRETIDESETVISKLDAVAAGK